MKATADYQQRYKNDAYKTKTDYLLEQTRLDAVKEEERILLGLCNIHSGMELCEDKIRLGLTIDKRTEKFILM